MSNSVIAAFAAADIADSGKIRLGGAFRLLPAVTPRAAVADAGAIRLGGAFRLLPVNKPTAG